MNRIFTRWARALAPVVLSLGLSFCSPVCHEARAQVDPQAEPESTESKGRPLDGYLATITLILLAFFIVGKSARR
jgi:hypothetical protein